MIRSLNAIILHSFSLESCSLFYRPLGDSFRENDRVFVWFSSIQIPNAVYLIG